MYPSHRLHLSPLPRLHSLAVSAVFIRGQMVVQVLDPILSISLHYLSPLSTNSIKTIPSIPFYFDKWLVIGLCPFRLFILLSNTWSIYIQFYNLQKISKHWQKNPKKKRKQFYIYLTLFSTLRIRTVTQMVNY